MFALDSTRNYIKRRDGAESMRWDATASLSVAETNFEVALIPIAQADLHAENHQSDLEFRSGLEGEDVAPAALFEYGDGGGVSAFLAVPPAEHHACPDLVSVHHEFIRNVGAGDVAHPLLALAELGDEVVF